MNGALAIAYPLSVLSAWWRLAEGDVVLAFASLIVPPCLAAAARAPTSIHVIGIVLGAAAPIGLAVGFDVHTALDPPLGLECSIPASVVVAPAVLVAFVPYAGLTTAVFVGAALAAGLARAEVQTR